MALQISDARTTADLAIVRQLFTAYAAELNVDLCFQGFDEELRSLPGRYVRPQGRLFLAHVNGAVAGCIALRALSHREAEVKRLYVQPHYRRRGVGHALVDAIISAAREERYSALLLDTLTTMSPAIALYEAFGFQRTSPYYANPLPEVVYLRLEL